MRYLILLQLLWLVLIASCGGGAGGIGQFIAKGDAPAVSSVNFANDQLIINGSNLAGVTSVSVEGEDFDVESISETQLIVNAQQALAFIAGATYNLLVSNAFGAASYAITFTPDNNSITTNMIVDNAITTNKIADEAITESKLSNMGASDGDFLQWDQTTTSWVPTTLNGLTYMGTWDASGAAPADPGTGGYYIVSVAGDTDVGTATDPWSVGDWVIRSDTEWQKIDNSNAVTNVFGRQGAITGVEGDYNIDLLGDVDTTTATPADGQVLTWDQAGGNWVPATESDPKVGTLTNGKWCTTDGNVINCEAAPGAETDPIFGAHVASSITDAGSGIVISVAERNGITNNASSISTNATNIATNDSDIATNVTNISTNATNISSNDTDISTNATNISSNDTDIATNVTNISTNATNISSNDTDIATNVSNISTNATNISSNDADIAAQATAISGKVTAAGEAGGQTITGGTGDDETLILNSSSATPGYVLINPAGGGKLAIGAIPTPALNYALDVNGHIASNPRTAGDDAKVMVSLDGSFKGGMAAIGTAGNFVAGSSVDDFGVRAQNNMLFSIAMSEKMRIANNGNVGIGSTSPAAKLDVAGAINAQQLCDENGANCFDLDSGAIAVSGDVSASGGNVSVGTTDATYNITFDGDSNQTIGVLEQSSGAGSSLTINSGGAQSGSTDLNGGNLILSSGSSTGSGGSTIEFKTATAGASGTVTATPSTKMIIDEAGNVGIGTTSVSVALQVGAVDSGTDDTRNIIHVGSLGAGQAEGGEIRLFTAADYDSSIEFYRMDVWQDDFRIARNGQNDFVLNSDGNVGIGITSPEAKLDLAWGTGVNARIGSYNNVGTEHGSAAFLLGSNVKVRTDGVTGSVVQNTHATHGYRAIRMADEEGITFHTVDGSVTAGTPISNERMRIDEDGKIGIGTTSPFTTLHISGDTTIQRDVDDAYVYHFLTRKSRAGGIVQYGDELMVIDAYGHDGTNYIRGTAIQAMVDGTPGTNDMPGALLFRTTNDGASSPTTKMVIKNDGKVGIGTTVPDVKLEIAQTSAPTLKFNSTSDVINDVGAINFEMNGFVLSQIKSNRHTASGMLTDLEFYTGDSGSAPQRMVIKNSGRVGIGTTAPLQKLDVRSGVVLAGTDAATAGALHFGGYYNGANIINTYGAQQSSAATVIGYSVKPKTGSMGFVSSAGNSSFKKGALVIDDEFEFLSAGASTDAIDADVTLTSRFFIEDTGNVGIGTTDPSAQLSVNGDYAFGDHFLDISSNGNKQWGMYFDQGSWLQSDFRIDEFDSVGTPTTRLAISSGNVGIGTTSPAASLEVVKENDNSQVFVTSYKTLSSGGTLRLRKARGTIANPTPVSGGDLVGHIYFQGYDGSNFHNSSSIVARIDGTPGVTDLPGRLEFYTAEDGEVTQTERMRIDSSGNVGIGTTSPTAKLEVNGTIVGKAMVGKITMSGHFTTSASWQKITGFDNDVYMTSLPATFDSGTNRITATRAGYFKMTMTGYANQAGTGSERYALGFYKNTNLHGFSGANYSASDTPLAAYTTIIQLAVGDYVEPWFFSSITGQLTGDTGSTGHNMQWYIEYIGE